ncbi:hypothetical protein MHW47_34725 [Streptomyces sp. OfavH-34-F]|uniref:hypothetical protein n=1 Tax=Streptomyces sp. OfavH-34-F TaxID=2917760 RepID=UPI001EF25633|nr:hypothetical protein [Streptomyces sp. OfavH-34-F]MCG7529574.1 hypothetical protein [Streptomyces sp. OfavH-34-F]
MPGREIIDHHPVLGNLRVTVPPRCDVCGALAQQYDATRDRDALLEIQNHPHLEPKLQRVRDWKNRGVRLG